MDEVDAALGAGRRDDRACRRGRASAPLDGALQPLKSGGFLMALKTGFPIVPVGLSGTFEARPRGSFVNRPQRVDVCYGEPIDAAAYGVRRKKELMEEVRARVLELSATPPAGR